MPAINRIKVSDAVQATRIQGVFSVKFPYHHGAVQIAKSVHGSYFDQGCKSWEMPGCSEDQVYRILEKIQTELETAGILKDKDRCPDRWIDWDLVRSAELPAEKELHVGETHQVPGLGIITVEGVSDPYPRSESKRFHLQKDADQLIQRVWYRTATNEEALKLYPQEEEAREDMSPSFM